MTYAPYQGLVLQDDKPAKVAPATDPSQITALTLLDKAVSAGHSVQALEKLLDLQERYEKREAEKAFAMAISQFQAECPPIVKRKAAQVGSGQIMYAPLGDIVEQIKDVLARHQLSFRFRIEDLEDGGIKVTCIVAHALGHSETTSMRGNPDDSGRKNAIQQVGSTVTYLQRYTLVGALGLTTADEDMDGRVMQDFITADQRKDLEERGKAIGVNMQKYLAYLGVGELKELRAVDYAKADQAMKDQEKAAEQRKAKAPAKQEANAAKRATEHPGGES